MIKSILYLPVPLIRKPALSDMAEARMACARDLLMLERHSECKTHVWQ